MANEISITVNAAISTNGQGASGNTTYRADLAAQFIGEEQTVATSAATLALGSVASPSFVYVRNLDATNYLQVDSANTFDKFPQKIQPGAALLLFPETGTIYAKANVASVQVFVIAA